MTRRLESELFQPSPSATFPSQEGPNGIREVNHRNYVGGAWDELGTLQFEFLVSQGLSPHHCLLDVGCGSLRGGVHFIRYLNVSNYLGLEKYELLVTLGIEKELGTEAFNEKRPEFVFSGEFDFDRFSKEPDFALAQSVFTHLAPRQIELCLTNLRRFKKPIQFFASFFEVQEKVIHLSRENALANYYYTRRELGEFAARSGWRFTYVGEWNHPRGQKMAKFERFSSANHVL